MTRQKIWDIILVIFSVYWTVFFLLDYWDKHPNHVLAFQYFRYTKLCTFLVLFGAGLSYLVTRFRTGLISKFYNGITVYLLGIVIVGSIIFAFNKHAQYDLTINNYFFLIFRLSKTFILCYAIILACYSIGNLLLNKMFKGILTHQNFCYDFSLGVILFTLILFLLGALSILSFYFILILVILFILSNIKNSLRFVKSTFIKPLKTKNQKFIGLFCLYITYCFLLLNFIAIDIPFPVGFDSRTLYINIANQLENTGSLIKGFPPYNWSLFISSGKVLSGEIETTLSLSFFSGILSLIALFHLSTKYFKLTYTYSSILILIICTLPAFANQLFVELKTDLGLLFFQIIGLGIFMELSICKTKNCDSIRRISIENLLLIFLGLTIGFGFGIKALNLLFIFAICIAIWTLKAPLLSSLGYLILMFAFVIFFKLNTISGLDKYHLGNDVARWIYLLLGLVIVCLNFYKYKSQSLQFLRQVFLLAGISFFVLSPWLVKNYSETKSLSPIKLIQGGPSGPDNSKLFEVFSKKINESK